MTAANTDPEQPVAPEPAAVSEAPAAPVVPAAPVGGPLLPERSSGDTDAAWGDYAEPSDDRLYRDRPPHWADY